MSTTSIHQEKNKKLDVYNMLNADKENVFHSHGCGGKEKNLIQQQQGPILRPALRSSNHEEQQKTFKHIRFNLSSNSSSNLTPTPPPKEFKRMGNQRKTLRNTRCLSTIVTEKERAEMMVQPSPRAPAGFVKSMARFYAENVKPSLNRSNSFSSNSTTPKSSPESIENPRKFSLFRSNSWSSKRGSKKSSSEGNSPNSERSSPSYSTKSADSGFADFPEVRKSIQSQRLEFLRSNMELFEESTDPNLTQMAESSAAGRLACSGLALMKDQNKDKQSKQRVTQSLSNIASLQTGLNIKRHEADDHFEAPLPAPTNGALNLLRPKHDQMPEKIRPKSFQESVADLSQLSQDFFNDEPVFSTPVRASFRTKRRPLTLHLEDAKTPSKREAKTRLRELKTKSNGRPRPWSTAVLENEDFSGGGGQQVDPSLLAVWSQFVNYEPTLQTLSSHVTPPINPM